MKSKKNSKRNIIQWIAYAIVMLTLVIKLVLLISGISQNSAYSTLDAISWTGLGLGVILLLISYLYPKNA
jgi:uncharacterized membrane protein YbhN (UPF0104 family)